MRPIFFKRHLATKNSCHTKAWVLLFLAQRGLEFIMWRLVRMHEIYKSFASQIKWENDRRHRPEMRFWVVCSKEEGGLLLKMQRRQWLLYSRVEDVRRRALRLKFFIWKLPTVTLLFYTGSLYRLEWKALFLPSL